MLHRYSRFHVLKGSRQQQIHQRGAKYRVIVKSADLERALREREIGCALVVRGDEEEIKPFDLWTFLSRTGANTVSCVDG